MQKVKEGDLIEVTGTENSLSHTCDYFRIGDKGKVVRADRTDCLVDFNDQGNEYVYSRGTWFVDYAGIKLISRVSIANGGSKQ